MLVYDVDDLNTLRLAGSDWRPHLNPDGYTTNLHLYADPDPKLLEEIN